MRRGNNNFFANLFSEKLASDRRFVGNLAFGRIGFQRTDDHEFILASPYFHQHGSAKIDGILLNFRRYFDKFGIFQNILQLQQL